MANDSNPAGLYPFLATKSRGADETEGEFLPSLLRSIDAKVQESCETKSRFFEENRQALLDAAKVMSDAFYSGGRLYTMGNGGSACDAAHLAVEFMHPVTTGRAAIPAIQLGVQMSTFSAISNDVGVDHAYARELDAMAAPGDVLVGFSTSGNSTNLMAAFEKASQLGLVTIGFAGADGGQMHASGMLDHCLVVRSDSIHRVQEAHVACYHILWDLVHSLMANKPNKHR